LEIHLTSLFTVFTLAIVKEANELTQTEIICLQAASEKDQFQHHWSDVCGDPSNLFCATIAFFFVW